MGLHRQIYEEVLILVPNIRELENRKESYLLRCKNQVPVNVCIDLQANERTCIVLCALPYDGQGNIVPAPYVEFELYHDRGQAIPIMYVDSHFKLERKTCSVLDEEHLNQKVYSWLVRLQRLGFKLEGETKEAVLGRNAQPASLAP